VQLYGDAVNMNVIARVLAFAAALVASSGVSTAQQGGGVVQPGFVTPNNCVAWVSTNIIKDVGLTCGGGGAGTPGGSNTQVQYNNSGSFGGITGATTDGTKLTLVAPVLGAATGTSLALGGATNGTNALAVTGTVNISLGITSGAGIFSNSGVAGVPRFVSNGPGNFFYVGNQDTHTYSITYSTGTSNPVQQWADNAGIVLLPVNCLVQFNGTTSSFPALKRSTTTLQVQLADDTGFANLTGAQVIAQLQTFTDAATIAWDGNLGSVAKVTLGGNRTMGAPTNIQTGGTYVLYAIQDGTGGRTLAYNAVFKWPAGVAPIITTTAGAVSVISCIRQDGKNLQCTAALGFS
jgi:hypothetical protein